MKIRSVDWVRKAGIGALVASLPLAAAPGANSQDAMAIGLVAAGMNQTELQSVMGPPDYIQVKELRQAWQYCPDLSLMDLLYDVMRQERPPDVYVTVWFANGRVEHMRAYPSRVMGECRDFIAAFRWEDDIEGGMAYEAAGPRRIK